MRIDRADGESELLGPPISNSEIVKVVAGDFEVRLAETPAEIDAAQALRYRIFYEEMTATPTPEMAATKRDFDSFDEVCDHLLVIDRRRGEGPEGIVGTYRLIRRPAAAKHGSFYSAAEYDITPMIDYPGEILELGRSCIAKDARNTATMQMLWRGIALYAFHYDIKVMFGCASFPGTQSPSTNTTCAPAVSVKPSAAAVLPMNTRQFGSFWNLTTCDSLSGPALTLPVMTAASGKAALSAATTCK